MPPRDRGVGSSLGPLGPPGRAKSSAGKVHRYLGSCGHCTLGWAGLGCVALRCALHCTRPLRAVTLGDPPGLTVGKKAPSMDRF